MSEKIIDLMFSGFWPFIGMSMLLTGCANFILLLYNRTWRHFNIRKHGWPPVHCDSDGDFKIDKNEEDD